MIRDRLPIKRTIWGAGFAISLLVAPAALASTISIDFNTFGLQGEAAEMSGPDETSQVGSVWNHLLVPKENGGVVGLQSLVNADGEPTSVNVEIKGTPIHSWWSTKKLMPESKLYRDYIFLPKPAAIQISGLEPNTSYQVAVFGYPLGWGKVELAINGKSLLLRSGTEWKEDRAPAALLAVTTDDCGVLAGTVSGMLAGLHISTGPIAIHSPEVVLIEGELEQEKQLQFTPSKNEPEQEKPPQFPPTKSVVYKTVKGADLAIDIYQPEGHQSSDRRAAIVFFHGGSWSGGWKTTFAPQCHYLAERGMVAMTAAYRVTDRPPKSTVEDCVRDAKSAMRWVRQNAAELGIDPDRIIAGGGSAGGHLAAATAYLDGYNEEGEDISVSCRPSALVLFNPVCDNSPGNGYHFGPQPIAETWLSWSPKHNITKEKAVPTIYFLGDQDHLISVATAEAYKKATKEAGAECELHIYPGAKHSFFHGGDALKDTLQKTQRFLARLGYLSKENNAKEEGSK